MQDSYLGIATEYWILTMIVVSCWAALKGTHNKILALLSIGSLSYSFCVVACVGADNLDGNHGVGYSVLIAFMIFMVALAGWLMLEIYPTLKHIGRYLIRKG